MNELNEIFIITNTTLPFAKKGEELKEADEKQRVQNGTGQEE